ncbi:MAG: hypothetical protein JWQ09_5909 [Segetibacter sp.]|nr:hypothetical protein [Segetibacter sp.]
MEQSIHKPSGSRLRSNNNKAEKEENLTVVKARHLGGYKILIWFSNGKQRIIDFEALFSKFVKGEYNKWFLPSNFKKFGVSNGNIFWGKNEEVIFPVSFLYKSKYGRTQKEEVLYVM